MGLRFLVKLFILGMGMARYLFRRMGYDAAPSVLGFVLGLMMENGFGQSIVMTQRDLAQVLTRPLILLLVGRREFSIPRF
jgi:putative tricarboxylic transport membrane protein